MDDPRYIAVKLLCKTFSGGSFSNLQLDSGLKKSDLDERGRKFCSALYYGVIERKLTLDHVISGLSSRSLNKIDEAIINILRCGIYQISYMDNVPDNAAVSESVSLAKRCGKTSASGMVNAILRNFIRSGKKYKLPEDWTEAVSVEYSASVELVEELSNDYGKETAESFLRCSLDKPEVYLRRNPLKCTEDDFAAAMGNIDVQKLAQPELRDCCYAAENGDVTRTAAFEKGFFHVQSLTSQLCCTALAPTANDLVLDICAAPGGKTFTMAELMNGEGQIYAFDLHEKRAELIRKGAERLGLTNIRAAAGDASRFDPALPEFTKILCDVPCSGFGVINRKPEIKYKRLADFSKLPEIQHNIARNALNYLAPGGEMIYSTCTVRKAENERVCERLLAEHPEIEPCELPVMLGRSFGASATLMPMDGFGDGFFIAKFRKVR